MSSKWSSVFKGPEGLALILVGKLESAGFHPVVTGRAATLYEGDFLEKTAFSHEIFVPPEEAVAALACIRDKQAATGD